MANEVELLVPGLHYKDDEGSEDSLRLTLANAFANVTTKKFIHHKQNIGTSEEFIDLGELTTFGWCFFINRDSTNFISLRFTTGGANLIKISALKSAGPIYLGSGFSTLYAIADTAACQLEYLVCAQ